MSWRRPTASALIGPRPRRPRARSGPAGRSRTWRRRAFRQSARAGKRRTAMTQESHAAGGGPEVSSASRDVVPFRSALRTWFAISLQTFGGPAGQIAVMQRTLVDEKRWIGQRRFLHALSYCTLLPGPEAQQLAIYVGWLLNGVRGGLAAGTLFVLPGVVALLGLSILYVAPATRPRHRPLRRAGSGGPGDRRPGRLAGRQAGSRPSRTRRRSRCWRSSRWRSSRCRSRS